MISKLVKVLLVFVFVASLSPTSIGAMESPKKQVIVLFKDAIDQSLVEKVNGEILTEYEFVPALVASLSEQGIDKLQSNPNILAVERDVHVTNHSKQVVDWGVTSTNAPLAWQSGLTGSGIDVAVIDSGISNHKDLVISGGVSYVSGSDYTDDPYGHGTHIAGIIAARNNEHGVVGIAPEASLYAVKVLDDEGIGSLSNVLLGIDWAIRHDMNIVNLSLGVNLPTQALEEILDVAYKQGILLVAAAGNSGTADTSEDTVQYPARYESVIAVSSTNEIGERDGFSSTGESIEVSAPGVNITSTFSKNKYQTRTGTSMAAGYVTGDLALLKQLYPHLTNVELRKVLHKHVLDLGVPGKDSLFGYGFIQAPSN